LCNLIDFPYLLALKGSTMVSESDLPWPVTSRIFSALSAYH
jgi:hypothetical protein